MTYDSTDPFEGGDYEDRPTWSWREKGTKGYKIKFKIVEAPKKVRAKKYKSKDYDYWPDGNPKYNAVIGVETNGEEFSLFMGIPSALFGAIRDAKNAAGKNLEKNGELTIMVTGFEEVDGGNDKRLFKAKYEPPKSDESWDDDEPPF